jgi:hypothetical protein
MSFNFGKVLANANVKQNVGKYSGVIAVQIQHKIELVPEGWVWLDEDVYLDLGLDVFLTAFESTMIELHTDEQLAQLPVVNPADMVLPGGTFFQCGT